MPVVAGGLSVRALPDLAHGDVLGGAKTKKGVPASSRVPDVRWGWLTGQVYCNRLLCAIDLVVLYDL